MGRHRHLSALAGAIVVAAIAAACAPSAKEPVRARYDCGAAGTVRVAYFDESVRLAVGEGAARTLPRARSGSGARFTDGTVLFWDRGRKAFFEAEPGKWFECTRLEKN